MSKAPRPVLSTKAQTLAALRALSDHGRLTAAQVLPLAWFTVGAWARDRATLAADIVARFGDGPLAVRSSAVDEDRAGASQAGKYATKLGVTGRAALDSAIDAVIASYGPGASPDNEVLIQPMLRGVRLSGVAMSRDPATGATYRVIDYAEGGDTTVVTAGQGQVRTFVCATPRPADTRCIVPPDMARVIALIENLEALFPGRALDVEFAIVGEQVFLLQVRALAVPSRDASADLAPVIGRIAAKIRAGQAPHPFLHGRSTVFGVMPDWNPAEIIGIRPRPLALSLYRELVTDAIWAYQRDNYGYRNLRSFPLLIHFAGQPYVDVRVSFNSFVPKDVDPDLADRLVDHYIDRLVAAPALHDKVEFEIVLSCASFDLPQRLTALRERGFSAADCDQLDGCLRALTNRIIDARKGFWRADAAKLDMLTCRRPQIAGSNLDAASRIYWLLEDVKRYGTLPFAGLARAGFIAVQLLKSLVAVGVFSADDYDRVMAGVETVGSRFVRDFTTLDRPAFLARYGHLRPGTYDLLSPRYDEAPDAYLGAEFQPGVPEGPPPFAPDAGQRRGIARLMAERGLDGDVDGLLGFIKSAIELREFAKFEFTRSLSDALALLKDWGAGAGFAPEDLSFAGIGAVREVLAGSDDPADVLARSIAEGRARFAETTLVRLPPLITAPEQAWAFHLPEAAPNFVTRNRTVGPVAVPVRSGAGAALRGAIVCIPSADPGYDWLFSWGIAGLVTAYGGANSHMAIRAGELGLPAAIGVGDTLFARLARARRILIDAGAQRLEILN
ncbi:MAG: PEP/pyruvate-binding domain-containing protein [Rhodospirillaceae bacterium]|nr:PEP/pyruvate-binding domain-containing protein [Rhodospirillaceae bacterium]